MRIMNYSSYRNSIYFELALHFIRLTETSSFVRERFELQNAAILKITSDSSFT